MSVTPVAADGLATAELPHTPSDATRLAVDRTRLAQERTTMAWVRTATSLITFGFSVYKFFQMREGEAAKHLIGPREFALIMISIGITALVLATWQHWQSMRAMRVHYVGVRVPRSLAALVGGLVSLLGILALIIVILRH